MSMMVANGGLSNGKLEMATAVPDEVLAGQTFYAGDKVIKTGTMTDRGAWSSTVTPSGSVTIPQGYHNGNGKVSIGNFKSATVNRSGNSTSSFTSSFDVKSAFGISASAAQKLSSGNFYGQVTAYNINREHNYPNSSISCSITSYVPSTGMLTVKCEGNYTEINITRYQVHAVWIE